jgi:hypothetical protein
MIQIELNRQQRNELQRIINNQPNFKLQGILGEFFDLYLVCEATAKKLIYYNTGSDLLNSYRVDMIESSAILFFPNKAGNIPINEIFKSGEGIRGNKTCRQLRNAYIHNLSVQDRAEIEAHFVQLKYNMEQWINLFIHNLP